THLRQAVVGEPPGQHFLVQGEQSSHERALIADDDALADQGVGTDAVLGLGGDDVLPARGDDDLLLAAGDGQVAIRIDLAQVPGVEPAVGEGLGRGRVIVVIPLEDRDALGQDLAVLGDAQLDAGKGGPHSADLVPVRYVDAHRGGGLGEPVAFQHPYPYATEEVVQPVTQ